MRYVEASQGSEHIPKLLGCYELELQPVFRRLLKGAKWRRIVNVGGGEGYYAVGMAFLLPEVTVHVFESSGIGRQLICEMAKRNGVQDRVIVGGFCDIETLGTALGDGVETLLIMDVEGGEIDLLNPLALPSLLNCTIVAELHEFVWPNLASTLARRFPAGCSKVEFVQTRLRRSWELPYPPNPLLRLWMGINLVGKTGEARIGGMQWMVIAPDWAFAGCRANNVLDSQESAR